MAIHRIFPIVAFLVLILLPILDWQRNKDFVDHFPKSGTDLNWKNLTFDASALALEWYEIGPNRLGFIPRSNIPNPVSARTPAGTFYTSFPFGFVALPWALGVLFGTPPNVSFLIYLARFFEIVSLGILFFVSFSLGYRNFSLQSWQATLIASCTYLATFLSPARILYLPTTWWTYHLGIPFYLLSVHFFQNRMSKSIWNKRLLQASLFLGGLCDWIIFFLGIAMLLTIAFRKNRKWETLKEIVSPLLIAFGIHLSIIFYNGAFYEFLHRLKLRTGQEEAWMGWESFFAFWKELLKENLGMVNLYLVPVVFMFLVLAIVRLKNPSRESDDREKLWDLVVLIAFPPIAMALFVYQHFYHHSFQAINLVFPLSLLVFTCLGILLIRWNEIKGGTLYLIFVVLVLFLQLPQMNQSLKRAISTPLPKEVTVACYKLRKLAREGFVFSDILHTTSSYATLAVQKGSVELKQFSQLCGMVEPFNSFIEMKYFFSQLNETRDSKGKKIPAYILTRTTLGNEWEGKVTIVDQFEDSKLYRVDVIP